MKIVIPMAGEGSRFKKAGYVLPKPLIDVEGKPMIQRVVENLPFDAEFIFIVRSEHMQHYGLSSVLKTAAGSSAKIITAPETTEGAACSVLLAKQFINSKEDLMISNCDEVMEYSWRNFEVLRYSSYPDDYIWVFEANDPKWSFARTNQYHRIVEVAEKKPISNLATCGVYYWSNGDAFVSSAEKMIAANKRVNNEFYVCPVYNEGIRDGRRVFPFYVEKMWGLGTPEDLEVYLSR